MENNQEENDLIAKLMDMTYYTPVYDVISRAIGTQESVYIAKLIRLYNSYRKINKLDNENFFWVTTEDLEFQTGLSYSQQMGCEKTMTEWGMIETQLKLNPAKKHYKINISQIKNLISLEKQIDKIFEDQKIKKNTKDKDDKSNKKDKHPKELIYELFESKFISDEEKINIQKKMDRIGQKSKENKLQSKSLENSKTSLKKTLKHINKVINKVTNKVIEDKSSMGLETKPYKNLLPAFINLKKTNLTTYKDAEDIFDYWNQFGDPLTEHTKNLINPTGILQDAFILISKRLKGNSTKEEIKAAIYQYYDMVVSTDKYFVRFGDPLQVKDIVNFFEFDKDNKARQKNRKSTDPFKTIQSWYWECGTAVVKGEQYLIEKYGRKPKTPYQAQPIPDQHPEVTERFKKIWAEKMTEDSFYHNGGGVNDENCFRKASVFLVDFYDRWWNKGLDYLSSTTNIKGMPMLLSDPKTMTWEFLKAIDSATKGMDSSKEITPAWLCGPGMEKRLLTYYRDQGILNDLSDQEEY